MYLELGGLIFLLPIALHVVKTILRKYSSLFIHDFDAVKRFPLINLALSFSLVFIQIPLLASIKLLRLFIMNNQKIAFYQLKSFVSILDVVSQHDFIYFFTMQNSSQLMMQGTSKEVERYQKVKVLGEGAMGKAYLVKSSQDNCEYVMKRINIGHLPPKEKQNALREAQLHSLLQHPNIVQFRELYQTTGDKLCIIMQYAEGGDLEEFIKNQNGKPLPQSTILSIFSQICLGLLEVHSKKIIHRDLKTANIFLGKDKQVKIGDFGISKTLEKTQMAATSMIGTPYYLSPQMVEGKSYSTKADIWALGVILYQLCSYKLPFQANSLPVLALKIMKGAFPPIPNNYSKDLKTLLLQLLSTDQKKRPTVQTLLAKPLINKFLPQEQKAKLVVRQQLRVQAKKEKEKEKKVEKVEKAEKIDDKDIKQKSKKEKEEKREQLRRQMREDLKKKRGQSTQQPSKSTLNIPEQKHQLKKSPRKDISHTPKLQVNTKIKKEDIPKPWKNKRVSQKSDVTVEIFAPDPKVRQQFESSYQTQPSKTSSSKLIEEGRKSVPFVQKLQNYHYVPSTKLQHSQVQQESYDQEQFQQEEIQEDIHTLMNDIKNIGEIAKQLPNPKREVCLFEDSDNFESTTTIPKPPPPQQELESVQQVINAESLQELRYILQENLGDNRFKQAYSTIKNHLDSYYEMVFQQEADRKKLKKQYMFNRQLLKDKLPFLTAEQFRKNIELLFTLIIYEEIQTHKNNKELQQMQESKYDSIL